MFNSPPLENDRLELLYQLSQTFNSSLDLEQVLNRIIDEVLKTVRAERGFVMLYNEEKNLVFRAARGLDRKTIDSPQFQISRSVVEKVAETGTPIITSDAQTDASLNMNQSIMMLGLRSILCTPLIVRDKVLGVIYIDNRLHSGIFLKPDLDLVAAIASIAAIAIENARLYEIAVEKGRMEKELQMAHSVQVNLLPRIIPQPSGWQFAAYWKPAREVAGDYYDFISLQDANHGIIVADVADKGMAAALFMTFTRSVLRASLEVCKQPSQAISHANHLICAESTDGTFVTLFFAQLDEESGEIIYVNAGHNPPLLFRSGQKRLYKLARTGIALGIDPEANYEQRTLLLNPGDMLVLYTDGLTEAPDMFGTEYGTERLEDHILTFHDLPADDLIYKLVQTLEQFTEETTQQDDTTIVVFKRVN